MTEYIEREAISEEIRKYYYKNPPNFSYGEGFYRGLDRAQRAILDAPAADVAPVRHGRWDSVKNPNWPAYSHDKCSICGWWNTKNALCYDGNKKPGHSLNYCPNCGAKMDLEE